MPVTFVDSDNAENSRANTRRGGSKTMSSAAAKILLPAAAQEDVDGTAELERVGFGSRAVRSHEEGEKEAAAGTGDDRLGEFHVAAGVTVLKFLFAQQIL